MTANSLRIAFLSSGLAVFTGLALSTTGCSTVNQATALVGRQVESREFSIENTWARATLKKEFLGFRRLNRMAPIVTERMVIQGNAIDGIVAYDRKTGSQLWRHDLVNGVEGGAQLAGEKLYFGSSDGQFYCVNALTGKTIWTYAVRAETLAPPTVESGVVYFQSGADVVYAVDAETGKQLWIYNRQVTGNLSIRATTRPTVSGEFLLAGFSDGFVVALKKRDGGLVWERRIGRGNRFKDVDSTPVVEAGNVYVSSFDGTLASLKIESGDVNWTVEEGGYVPVTIGRDRWADRLFFSTANGQILFIDKKSGKTLGSFKLTSGIATQPILFKSYLIYGESEGGLVVANADTGATIARYDSGMGLVARPSVIDQTSEAYFISNAANLYALKLGYRSRAALLPWQKSL